MFSDDEKNRLLSDIREIREEQATQNSRLDTIERAIEDNPENNQDGMRSKINRVARTVEDWQSQVKGAKLVFGGIAFLMSTGIVALLINAFTGGSG